MKNKVQVVLGLILVGYLVFVIYSALAVAAGTSTNSFADLKIHFIILGVLLVLGFIGLLSYKKSLE